MRKKDIIELSITVVLVFILIIVTGVAIKAARRARKQPLKPATAAATPITPVISVSEPSAENNFAVIDKEAGNTETKRDPFSDAPAVSEGEETGVSLTGIIWDRDSPMAIINGQIMKVGDQVSGKIIIAIKQDRVVLNDGIKDTEFGLGE